MDLGRGPDGYRHHPAVAGYRAGGQKKVDDAWAKQVSALPAEKQVEAVLAKKLKELNPDFDGKVTLEDSRSRAW